MCLEITIGLALVHPFLVMAVERNTETIFNESLFNSMNLHCTKCLSINKLLAIFPMPANIR